MKTSLGFGSYICMPRPEISDAELLVRAVEPVDIEAIRIWRNAQMEVLRQKAEVSASQQAEYYSRHVWPEKSCEKPSNILLAIIRAGCLIGYGGLVHVAWEHRRAEVSFLLAPELELDADTRAVLFNCFLRLMKTLAFEDLGLARLFTETYATRRRHIETLESCGFIREGRQRHHVQIEDVPVDSLIHGVLATDEGNRHAG